MKDEGLELPYVLGLTASPVMQSSPESVNQIEQTLDAICRTPAQHRAELLLQVKLPVLFEVTFRAMTIQQELAGRTRTVSSLGEVYAGLEISNDPYVVSLRRDSSARSQRALGKVYQNNKTWCSSQLKTFYSTALTMWRELGAWAADFYIAEVIAIYDKVGGTLDDALNTSWDVSTEEKHYIAKALRLVDIAQSCTNLLGCDISTSDKVNKLIQVLIEQYESAFRGIVFVSGKSCGFSSRTSTLRSSTDSGNLQNRGHGRDIYS